MGDHSYSLWLGTHITGWEVAVDKSSGRWNLWPRCTTSKTLLFSAWCPANKRTCLTLKRVHSCFAGYTPVVLQSLDDDTNLQNVLEQVILPFLSQQPQCFCSVMQGIAFDCDAEKSIYCDIKKCLSWDNQPNVHDETWLRWKNETWFASCVW